VAVVCSQAGRRPHLVPTVIREILPGDAKDIREFNSRLEKAGITFSFPVDSSGFMPQRAGVEAPYQTGYVLSDGSGVRGGYILKHERVFAGGEGVSIGNYQLPLSLGIVDRKYAMVGVQLIKDALARQPRLYCLGMGSTARPLPRLLSKLGWSVSKVPFLFRIENAGNFTREIRFLRQRRGLPMVLNLARITGALAGSVALMRLYRWLLGAATPADVSIDQEADLPEEIDELFMSVRGDHGLMCDRRAAAMRSRLPVSDPKLSRFVLRRAGKVAGWAVISVSQLANHTQFGNMKVGCLVDGLAMPVDVGLLIHEVCRRLEAAHCDLLVSNQTHPLWVQGLRRQGFFAGPSNFVLALSPPLAASHANVSLAHFNRGDGDGPINL
jgi:hypothetical protein